MNDDLLKRLLETWKHPKTESELNAGASPAEIENAQKVLGRTFPKEFIDIYRNTNGAYLLEGNLSLHPLSGGDLTVVQAANFLRGADWPIPEEVVVFGDNGGDEVYGMWLPTNADSKPLIVQIGSIFEPNCMAIVGTSILNFLLGRTAFFLGILEAPKKVIQLLDVPKDLINNDPDDNDFEAIMRWADPQLPKLPLDAYEARLDAEKVQKLADR